MSRREDATVRVGVVGLGYWGPNLARNFAAIPGLPTGVALRELARGAREVAARSSPRHG